MLADQERDGKPKSEEEDLLCLEVKMIVVK
jgi:hypothetical protein